MIHGAFTWKRRLKIKLVQYYNALKSPNGQTDNGKGGGGGGAFAMTSMGDAFLYRKTSPG